ncbi:hypothetical protein BBP40_000658 [Aspergillus hancockii]|nr:hypothetical protein BBP40_000658 [Aspergillus hancockii]
MLSSSDKNQNSGLGGVGDTLGKTVDGLTGTLGATVGGLGKTVGGATEGLGKTLSGTSEGLGNTSQNDAIASADEPLPDSRNDRQDSTASVAKIVHNAKAATDKEQQMTLLQGIKLYPKAVAWSVFISTCIVMEGDDISLVNNFYAFDQFNRKYGELTSDGKYEVPARWQAGLSNVIAYLPNGVYGTVSAAAVISRMRLTFPQLQFGLMVGIGGGIPSKCNDSRLGDVVVSKPGGKYGGVIQYDYGKAVQSGQFEPTGILNQPPPALLTHVSKLEEQQMTGGQYAISKLVNAALEQNPNIKERFSPPEQQTDFLFCSFYHHADKGLDCEKCDKEQLFDREPRDMRTPYIHYGLIASGNRVMKDPESRDRLAQ